MAPAAFEDCTLALIVGGRAIRLGGLVKSELRLPDGQSIRDRTIALLERHVDEIILCGSSTPAVGRHRVLSDLLANRGAAAGVHAVCLAARTTWVLALAGDLPFVSLDVLRSLWTRRVGADVVVAGGPGSRLEPLHAFYRASTCAPVFAEQLGAGERSFGQLFSFLRTAVVPCEELRIIDPELSSFTNVNTWDDVARLGLACPG